MQFYLPAYRKTSYSAKIRFFLDLLSKNIKTNRNKIVFFAVEFLKEKYEEIYNRNIGDASIHQYDVSYG